jgi:RHS repeat-associated protein
MKFLTPQEGSATRQAGGFAYTHDYDRYGNRWHQYLNGTCPAGTSFCLTFDTNNRISNGAQTYDTAGNVIADSVHHYFYDAENRLIQVGGTPGTCATATACYVYDADGQRVQKTASGASVYFLYDLVGHPFTEINSSGTWDRTEVYAAGGHLATYSGGVTGTTYFTHSDWLGTERARTTVAGAIAESCTSLPFGDGMTCAGNDISPLHFTGKERDSESGFDNFGARYDSSSLGRFMSPDDFTKDSDVGDPRSWNMYAYARDNPLRYTDPTGETATVSTVCVVDTSGKTTSCHVTITMSIAIYAVDGTSPTQLKKAQSAITSQIDDAWSGSFTQNGIEYNVTTDVTVSIVDSNQAGVDSKAQNIIGISFNGNTSSHIDPNSGARGYDTGVFDFDAMSAAHEFGHMLGLDDNHGDVLSNATSDISEGKNPHATTQDFLWALGPQLKAGLKNFTVGQKEGFVGHGNNRHNRKWWEGYLSRN